MPSNKKPYTNFQLVSAIFMMAALLWLTVSMPFVFACQQEQAKGSKTAGMVTPSDSRSEEEAANPFGNNTEEKNPNSSSFSEEYLHDHHTEEHSFSIASSYQKCENAGIYIAFHGELLVPPPDASLV